MPATRMTMIRGGKTVFSYSVSIPGTWARTDDQLRAAWNRAAVALNELATLIDERTNNKHLPLPVHYRDNGELCEYSESRDMASGCPRGCASARTHYANDGHLMCAEED
ncbi:hypothetical protein SEA_JEDEDIAH_52 [Mycobacterium phage Jedediah]|uniref:Uncharacterized protein n=5 Tax=Bixzunavirus TaxID=680114 RepID=Q853M5_BPMBZ|nr:gp52 [Mycobacterium phage Bxz1]YP_009221183.1 hypothetical protein AWH68_gp053 [Mycobacterium phage Breeniome]YP_010057926.1 hypothetical protein KHO62_gp052 [Mycobacterium phage NoodleTree]AEK07042.1 hypothetical protein DRAZDYS_51 [Mycobacterium phage Drazdys]AER49570.1 hypothetical protein PIO_56 [Mycobacterium phage Pio]AOZ63409.1 hypothetical protein SEA_GABRIEL_53 [Mycobacterium phage Gabriel]QAY06728.1 hypothetical protein SEA_PHUSCO_51 [Mycobacterium phage Phusco]QAY07133.1 hypoth